MEILNRGAVPAGRDLAAGDPNEIVHPFDGFGRDYATAAVRDSHRTYPIEKILAYSKAGIAHLQRPENLLLDHLREGPSAAIGADAQCADDGMRDQDRIID